MIRSTAKATNIRWFVLGAALLCLGAGPQAAPARTGDCSPLPGTHVRVRLTVAPEGIPLDERIVKGVVERNWSAEGIEVEWISEAVPFSWTGVDLWVRVRRDRLANLEPSLAAVHVENGQVHKFVQVSIDSTIERLKGAVARKYLIPESSALHLLVAGGLRDVEESIGHSIAREMTPCAAAR
ncbi:MAG: hypothetical protein ABI665_08690 [Vicinamibacterales bacterium]